MTLQRRRELINERNAVIFSLDREKITAYASKRHIQVPEDDEVFWAGVFKMICNIASAPDELVLQARIWLAARGIGPSIESWQ